MKNLVLLIFMVALSIHLSHAQKNVGINTPNPDPSAALDITSSDKGVLIPRMSKGQRDQIPSPATGLMIYQNDGDTGFYYYNGNVWTIIGGNASGGTIIPDPAGNAGKVLSTDGSSLNWSDQAGALTLYDGNGNRLGRVTSYGATSYTIITSTGYSLSININGTVSVSQIYWTVAGCSGTPYFNSGGSNNPRNAAFLVYSGAASKFFKTATVTNGYSLPVSTGVWQGLENPDCKTNSNGNIASGYLLTEISNADAGINVTYPFALPLLVK